MDKYPDMGEVTGLRLELGRMTDKANALEAALRKEVLAIVREEIAKAKPKKMYDTKPDGTICIVAEDEEIAALKVDVEHVKFWNGQLKAENDRLRSQFANSEQENARLKAEVERLRKAGDAVCESPYALETDPAVIEWRAAKEGKPTE